MVSVGQLWDTVEAKGRKKIWGKRSLTAGEAVGLLIFLIALAYYKYQPQGKYRVHFLAVSIIILILAMALF